MMKRVYATTLAAACTSLIVCSADTIGQEGTLVPPPSAFRDGKPVQFMKSLNEIEPRVKIGALPFDIVRAGSYYVAGNLTGQVSTVGITIHTPDVNLDLNGFSLIGIPNTRSGVHVLPNCVNVSIRNGVVRGWGEFGIDATDASDVELLNVRAFTNLVGGLRVGPDSMVLGCGAYRNVGEGIRVGAGSTIKNSRARGNAVNGFRADPASLLSGCISTGNRENGFFLDNYCTIRDSTAAWNGSNGIVAQTGCRVQDNNCGENGTAGGNGAGILVVGEANRIEDNMLTGNRRGIHAGETDGARWGQGNLIIRNSARGSQDVDFAIHPNNAFGSILLDISASPAGMTNDNPWLNFVLPQ